MTPLTQKEISGYGYYHIFKNNKTGEQIEIKCSQEEYERMGVAGGAKYRPVMDGCAWVCSHGGRPEIEGRPIKDGEMMDMPDGQKIAKIDGREVLLEEGDLDANNNFVGTIK